VNAERSIVSTEVEVAAPAWDVWAAVTDWERQDEWMLGTTTRAQGREGVGQQLSAFTGRYGIGLLDTMTVTEWVPPRRVVVEHTGPRVRGLGIIEVITLGPRSSRLLWREELDLPFGRLGRLGFPVVRPAVVAGVTASLRKLARQVEERAAR